jgi:hypothetical protein
MAEFSKQWCEINYPGMSGDFDILEEANKLNPNNYIPMICEGYGFVAIAKDETGEILLALKDWDTDTTSWVPYNEIVK